LIKLFDNRRNSDFFKIILTAVISSLAVGLFLSYVTGYFGMNTNPPATPPVENITESPKPQQIVAETTTGTPVAASVAKSATAGVVGISVLRVDTNSIFDSNAAEKWGIGSGVVVSKDGYILTNHHVAGGKNKRIVVSFADGKEFDGVTVWSDSVLDLAVVKVNAKGLTPIPLGDANTLQVGEPAIAIGNPLGLQFQRTVTSGIISALNRTIQIETEEGLNYMEDLIQTDASINPGNSGGPLLNSKGEVVGINTIKVASAEGIGFAIPINVAVPIIRQFTENGSFNEPYMGIFAYDREVIPYLEDNIELDNGIYVVNVDTKGPAYDAGIRVGCIIKQVDGIEINTMMQLRTYIYSKKPGDIINVTHLDRKSNKLVTIPIKLAEKEKDGLITR